MKKNDGWINALFALVFIAVPALLIFLFILPTWTDKEVIPYWAIWLVAISFVAYVSIFSFLLIKYEWLTIDSISFNIPISLSLMCILVTYPLALWAVAIIVILSIFTAIPANVYVTKYNEEKAIKSRDKIKNRNKK